MSIAKMVGPEPALPAVNRHAAHAPQAPHIQLSAFGQVDTDRKIFQKCRIWGSIVPQLIWQGRIQKASTIPQDLNALIPHT